MTNDMTVASVVNYLQNSLNILAIGPAGTGKTQMLREAASKLGYKMKYYNAATLDPFTDLVGIPVPQNESKVVEFYRPQEIDEVDVVFFDELNRADPRTQDAVFEIIQFRSINGTPLPKLKAVVAAMNPMTEGYKVGELDTALLDRFDIYLKAEPRIDFNYFSKRFGSEIAKEVTPWWKDEHKSYREAEKKTNNKRVYISPRRMEKIVSAYLAIPKLSTIENSLPIGAVVNVRALENAIKKGLEAKNVSANPTESKTGNGPEDKVKEILGMTSKEIRQNSELITKVVEDVSISPAYKRQILNSVASALNSDVSIDVIVKDFSELIEHMTVVQKQMLYNGWSASKQRTCDRKLDEKSTVPIF